MERVKIILQNYPRGDLYGDNITQRIAEEFNVPFVDHHSAFQKEMKFIQEAQRVFWSTPYGFWLILSR